MRHYWVALSPNPPKDTLQFLLCGPGEETGQHVPDHRLGRVQVRSGTVRGIFASLPERPRRSPSGFSSLASTRPAMNRFCQRSNVALVEIARQPDRQIVLVFDTSYQRQNLRLDQTRKDENPFLCETCHKRKKCPVQSGKLCSKCRPVILGRRKLKYLCQDLSRRGDAVHCGTPELEEKCRRSHLRCRSFSTWLP